MTASAQCAPATVAAAFALTRVLAAGEGVAVGSATEAVAAAAAFLADEGARGDLALLDIAPSVWAKR